MGDFGSLVLLLLPLAAATGWFVARQSREPEEQESGALNSDYVRGLSHLVNNDTDQAIEVFIGLMEADEGTIDLHLALGSLFRKRGEVDRALRIHQNLVERGNLKPVHRNQARYELARDYLAAGVLDRAEEIFLELAHQGMFLTNVLKRLLRIYEREREWDKAIDTARWLASAQGRDLGPRIAQYWCELAESAQRRDDAKAQDQYLKKALSADRHCVRAQLIQAAAATRDGKPARALKLYRDILQHHREFVPDMLPAWREAYFRAHDEASWPQELARQISSGGHAYLIVELLASADPNDEQMQQLALESLKSHPNWIGLKTLLDQAMSAELDSGLRSLLETISLMLEKPLVQAQQYLCDQCGFQSGTMNWQCPSCHEWNTTRPIPDLPASVFSLDDSQRVVASGASVIS